MKHLVAVAVAAIALAGCDKKQEPPKMEQPASKQAPAKAEPKKTGGTKLSKLKLQIDVPGEVMIMDGMGTNAHLISGPEVGGMNVAEAGDTTPKTLKDAEEHASVLSPKNTKKETLADGWAITYENTGSMGTNYFVSVRREIGGKAIVCDGTLDTAAKATAVLAACKTLKPE